MNINELLSQIVEASGGVVTNKGNRNQLLSDWYASIIPYYAYFDGVNNYGLLDGPITLTGAFTVTIKSTFSSNGFWIFTTKSATEVGESSRLLMTNSGSLYVEGTIVRTLSSEEFANLCDGSVNELKIYRDEANQFYTAINGVSVGTVKAQFAESLTFDSLFTQYSSGTSVPFFEGYPEYIKLDDSNMWTIYNSYSKNTLTVNDSIGSNNITLYNFQDGDFVEAIA